MKQAGLTSIVVLAILVNAWIAAMLCGVGQASSSYTITRGEAYATFALPGTPFPSLVAALACVPILVWLRRSVRFAYHHAVSLYAIAFVLMGIALVWKVVDVSLEMGPFYRYLRYGPPSTGRFNAAGAFYSGERIESYMQDSWRHSRMHLLVIAGASVATVAMLRVRSFATRLRDQRVCMNCWYHCAESGSMCPECGQTLWEYRRQG